MASQYRRLPWVDPGTTSRAALADTSGMPLAAARMPSARPPDAVAPAGRLASRRSLGWHRAGRSGVMLVARAIGGSAASGARHWCPPLVADRIVQMYHARMNPTDPSMTLSELLDAARAVVTGIPGSLWQASGDELAQVVRALDDIGAAARGATVAAAAEALVRGETQTSQSGSVVAWLREHAPSLRQGGAKAVAECAGLVASERRGLTVVGADVFGADVAGAGADVAGAGADVLDATAIGDADGPEAPAEASAAAAAGTPVQLVMRSVLHGELLPVVAMTVMSEMARLERRLRPETHATVASALVSLGRDWGSAQVRRLRPRLLADYGLPGELQADHDTLARSVTLSSPTVEDGLTAYRLVLDPESAATLEAAIGPLAAPAPNPETGARDLRTAGQRRANALIEVCRRATTAGHHLCGGAKTTLFVTMGLTELRDAVGGAGTIVGTPAAGVMLAPETVRRLACEADIVPTVLGTRSEVLDLGVTARLFTRAQTKMLWLRDGGCSFPGCSVPAHWCDAHHIVHWIDGGTTTVVNAALLCSRHHQIVHRDRLTAHVLDPPPDPTTRAVQWDCSPGSYDRAIGRFRAA